MNAEKFDSIIREVLEWLRHLSRYHNIEKVRVEDVREYILQVLEDHEIEL